MRTRWMPNEMWGRSRSSGIASAAAGQGTIRLQELAMPFSIDSTTAVSTASCMPKSSQLTISTRGQARIPAVHSTVHPPRPTLPDRLSAQAL
jgi:hypothetical protein